MLTMKGKYGLKAMVHLAGCRPGEPELILSIATEQWNFQEVPRRDPR